MLRNNEFLEFDELSNKKTGIDRYTCLLLIINPQNIFLGASQIICDTLEEGRGVGLRDDVTKYDKGERGRHQKWHVTFFQKILAVFLPVYYKVFEKF